MPSRSSSPRVRSSAGIESIASTRASWSASGERAELGDALGVHEARVEVADLARLGAGLGLLRLFDDRVDVLLGLLGDEVERAPAGLVLGDLGAFEPGAVDVAEQVVLRADLSTELVERETGSGGIGHAYRICVRRGSRMHRLGNASMCCSDS